MADRSFNPPLGHLEINVVTLYGKATIGASGAVSSSSGLGVTITKLATAGQYQIALADSYNSLLFAGISMLDAVDPDPATEGVLSRVLSQDVSSSTAPKLVVQFSTADDGADADVQSGAVLYFQIVLSNTTVSY